MGMLKKPNISELENRIAELEEQVSSISNDDQYLQSLKIDEISKAILLFAEVEELDFLILDLFEGCGFFSHDACECRAGGDPLHVQIQLACDLFAFGF